MLDFSKLGTAAAEADDLTVEKSYEREVPRAGVALLRLKDYIETGRHEGRVAGHKASLHALLTFELSHPDHLIEVDGKKVPQQIRIRLNKGATSKSGYRKLFNIMNEAHGGKFKHFVQMIGLPFLGKIYHNKSEDGKTTYANLDKDGAYSLQAPVVVDPIANTERPIPVPELHGTPLAFLWENEAVSDEDVKAMWDSIFIEGTREVTKDGVKKEVSKNWIQETIMSNLEWEGSRTQGLVTEYVSLEDAAVATVAAEAAKPAQEQATKAAEPAAIPSLED